MQKDFYSKGSNQRQKEPKSIKEVINDYFQSNEPLAMASRLRLASDEISAEKGGEV